MNTLPFDSHNTSVWEEGLEKPQIISAKCLCVCVCVRECLCASGEAKSCQETVLPSSLLLSSSPSSPSPNRSLALLQQTGRRSASGQSPAAPDGSCCQQATWIVWTPRATLWHAEVRRNHSTQNWPTAQLEEMQLSWFRTPNEISPLHSCKWKECCSLCCWETHLEKRVLIKLLSYRELQSISALIFNLYLACNGKLDFVTSWPMKLHASHRGAHS